MISIMEIKVRGFHVDHFGHVNHARYIEFLEEGRWDFFERYNMIGEVFHNLDVIPIVTRLEIDYRKAASTGDRLTVRTELSEAVRHRLIFSQKILFPESSRLAVSARITGVMLDTKSGKIASVANLLLSV